LRPDNGRAAANEGVPVPDRASVIAAIEEARRQLYQAASKQPAALGGRHVVASNLVRVYDARVEIADLFPVNASNVKIRSAAVEAKREQEALLADTTCALDAIEPHIRARLNAAIGYLLSPGADDLPAVASLRQRAGDAMTTLRQLLPFHDAIKRLNDDDGKLQVLWEALGPDARVTTHGVDRAYRTLVGRMRDGLRHLRDGLGTVPYPFEHARADATVGLIVVPEVPTQDFIDVMHAAGEHAINAYLKVLGRLLADVTEVAERVELHLGLPADAPVAEYQSDPAEIEKQARAERTRERRHWIGYGARAAAGVALVGALVWYSVAPPALPAMTWNHNRPGRDRDVPPGLRPNSIVGTFNYGPRATVRTPMPVAPTIQLGPQGPIDPARVGPGFT
jgi:hypothetical protein